MNHDENLTYQWLRNLRDSLLEQAGLSEQKCPSEYPKAASQYSKYAQQYGDFCFKDLGGDKIEIQPEWVKNNIVRVRIGNQTKLVNKQIANLLPQVYQKAAQASGYEPIVGGQGEFGPYSPRYVEGGGLSSHAWGMAIDFDPRANPFDKEAVSTIEQNPNFWKTFEANGFKWLGNSPDHPGIGDDMHFHYTGKVSGVGDTFISSDSGIESEIDPFQPSMGQATTPSLLPFLAKLISEENGKLIDPKKFKVSDRSKDKLLKKNKNLLRDMLSYFDRNLAFEKPVSIHFVDDEQNFQEPLGKTAYYDPKQSHITIYVTGRLLKDILRSLGHELIHHKQHCNGELDNVNTFEGYAQKDKNLREMEKQAFLEGNMLFRDWEDTYKSNH